MTTNLTATERKIMDLLEDGESHTKEEVHSCLPDELGALTNVYIHIHNVRKKIRPNLDIVFERLRGRSYYRLVRFVDSVGDEE